MTTAVTISSSQNAALERRLPHWLTEVLDSVPGMPWQPPARLPKPGDIRDGIARCNRTLEGRVSATFARQCFAKMLAAFEPSSKASGDETRLRMAVWMEACGDLNDAMWAEATSEAIQTSKWMPKPAEFRAFVAPQIDRARLHKYRLEQLAQAVARQTPAAFKPEPEDVRVRGLRDSFKRIGRMGKAADYERQLARMEGRPPEEWVRVAVDPVAESSTKLDPTPGRPMSQEMREALNAALAAKHREQGRHAYADRLAPVETEAMEVG